MEKIERREKGGGRLKERGIVNGSKKVDGE